MASKFHCKGIVVKTASKINPAGGFPWLLRPPCN